MRQQLSLEHRTLAFLQAGLFTGGADVYGWATRNFARALCFLVHFYFVTVRIEGEIC